MNKIKSYFLLLIKLSLMILIGESSFVLAMNQNEVTPYLNKAITYLKAHQMELNTLPKIELKDQLPYNGYFNRNRNTLQISSKLDDVQLQLTLVHELTHAFRFLNLATNQDETLWLNEGLANLMEYKYSGVWPVNFHTQLRESMKVLISDNEDDFMFNGAGYSGSFFFIIYLYNHFGGDTLLHQMLISKKVGWDNVLSSIRATLLREGVSIDSKFLTKNSLLRHFAISIWLNDSFSADYGFFQLDTTYEALRYSGFNYYQEKSKKVLNSVNSININQANIISKREVIQIEFFNIKPNGPFNELWALKNSIPIKIFKPNKTDSADVFIGIQSK